MPGIPRQDNNIQFSMKGLEGEGGGKDCVDGMFVKPRDARISQQEAEYRILKATPRRHPRKEKRRHEAGSMHAHAHAHPHAHSHIFHSNRSAKLRHGRVSGPASLRLDKAYWSLAALVVASAWFDDAHKAGDWTWLFKLRGGRSSSNGRTVWWLDG